MPTMLSKLSLMRAGAVAALLAALCPGAGQVAAQAKPGESTAHATDPSQLRARAAAQSAAALKALHRARKSHDPALRCLDGKLAQLNSTRREIDERSLALERARAAGKHSEAEHQTLVLRYLERRLDRLGDEASCRPPASAGHTGHTRVELSLLGPMPEGEPVEI